MTPGGQQPPLPRWHDAGHAAYSACMADLLADAKAELYQADPEDFTSRRQELVARAREAGETAAAKQIGALRKPTRSAWALNRLVYADPEVPARLARLADELRQAGPSADGGRIRELTAARSQLVDELTRQAFADTGCPARRGARGGDRDAGRGPGRSGGGGQPRLPGPRRALGRLRPGWRQGPPPSAPPAKSRKPAPVEPSAERERRYREKITSAERSVADAVVPLTPLTRLSNSGGHGPAAGSRAGAGAPAARRRPAAGLPGRVAAAAGE